MVDIIPVVHRFDAALAVGMAAARGAQVLAVDPVMHTHIANAGLASPWVKTRSRADVAGQAYEAAERATLALSRELGGVLGALGPTVAAAAWNAHRIFHLFWTAYGYQRLWPEALEAHPDAHWHILLPQQAHCYGVHSFVPALTLADLAQQAGRRWTAYGYDCPGLETFRVPDLRRLPPDTELLCHLPTCHHDAAYVAAELQASGWRVGVLSSQMYDIELPGFEASGLLDLAELRALLDPAARARVAALEEPVKAVLLRHLAALLPRRTFLERQQQSLWEALELQALFYLWLEQCLGARPPRQLLISSHDALVHGALMSFAARYGLATSVLPHSRVNNVAVGCDGLRPLCLHHGLQDGPSLDLAGLALPAARLRYPGDWREPAGRGDRLATLGLVLNGISANGMCMIDFEDYLEGIRRVRLWAQAQGLRLRLRVRAAETPVALLAERLQIPVDALLAELGMGLLDFARGCDLCLGYDVPTSGLQDLVRDGIAVMQAECRPLNRAEWSIVDAAVVPRHTLTEALARLAVLAANPAEFRRFRDRQYVAALSTQQGARTLRDCLTQALDGAAAG